MIEKINHHNNALIILHEIYGTNRFIEDVCTEYHRQGFDVFCPEMLRRKSFLYSESSEAYHNFVETTGFDIYIEIEQLLEKLKLAYEKVFIIGFSVGATIAWRCCENANCDGIVCCYGSRIRDYLQMRPGCPVLLLFAGQDAFDVDGVINQLHDKPNAKIHKLKAEHGFIDHYSDHFDRVQAQAAKDHINAFLTRYA